VAQHGGMTAPRFATYVYRIAAVWGILVLSPLYFLFDRIGETDPPPITHPGFYYGFLATALTWQVLFAVISANPARYVAIIPVTVLEKFGYALTVVVLYVTGRMNAGDLVFAGTDALLGILFVAAFLRLRSSAA
jgi:hypothetical protein